MFTWTVLIIFIAIYTVDSMHGWLQRRSPLPLISSSSCITKRTFYKLLYYIKTIVEDTCNEINHIFILLHFNNKSAISLNVVFTNYLTNHKWKERLLNYTMQI